MKYRGRSGNLAGIKTPCLAVGIFEGGRLGAAAETVDKACGGSLSRILAGGDLTGKAGETLMLRGLADIAAERVLLVGLGKQDAWDTAALQQAGRSLLAALRKTAAKSALATLLEEPLAGADAEVGAAFLVTAVEHADYVYDELKSSKKTLAGPETLEVFAGTRKLVNLVKKGLERGICTADGMSFARRLGDSPGNVCTPGWLAGQAKALAKEFDGIKTSVLEEKDMQKLGMHSLLAVSQGSAEPAKLIVMEYRKGREKDKPHVLVGKGISFDTGGISLKPSQDMGEMKYDMCGAASVFGTLRAVAGMQLPINLVCVVASAENMPGSKAVKPGDIVRSLSGKTIEINNTDAEGRLVLCDALTYIDKYKPETVIDIATLTGACVIALGHHATGLMSNDDALAADLLAAGEKARDRAWRLPIWEDYQKQLYSNHADMSNIGGRPAGTITAACFLARFTTSYRWAHLDIAGTGYTGGRNKHATGRPVGLLVQYLLDRL